RIVDLDQRRHPQVVRQKVQLAQPAFVETLGDQQHAVGPGRSGFVDLIRIEQKILSQYGERYAATNGDEIVERTAEEPFVGEHTDAARAVLFVNAGDRTGI